MILFESGGTCIANFHHHEIRIMLVRVRIIFIWVTNLFISILILINVVTLYDFVFILKVCLV